MSVTMKKINVLIVDDSIVFREILAKGIQIDDSINVVSKAIDPFDARDKILEFEPDVVTCDIEMPRMNGIEFIKRLMPQYPVPVIVVSSVSNQVFDAMNAGAVDFISKPNPHSPEQVQEFIMLLIKKIKEVAKAKIITEIKNVSNNTTQTFNTISHHQVIAIGASTGGTEAIFSVLKQLPVDMPGILIIQHIPPGFSRMFAERLNNQTHFNVKEAKTGDSVRKNTVLIAPGDQHMQLVKGQDRLQVKVFHDKKVNGHCPSVDVLFNSVAKELGDRAVGVILTGMGYDGAKGIAMMKRKGAITIGQDERSSVVYGMPKVAYEIGGLTKQIALEFIGHYICKSLR